MIDVELLMRSQSKLVSCGLDRKRKFMRFVKQKVATLALILIFIGGTFSCAVPAIGQTVKIKGSDTLLPLAERWAQVYSKKDATVHLVVSGGGSSVGIAALLRGDADIAEASRPVNDSEKEQFKKEGKTLVEVTVASDAVEILVSPSNPISSMTMEQVRGIFTGRISNWKEVGGLDGKINLYGREKASGTNAFLKEHALRGENYATTITEFSSNAPMVSVVAKDPNGICYAGLAAGKNTKHLHIKLDANASAVEPNSQNVTAGKYPLSRKLHWYLANRPSGKVKELCEWILSPDGQVVVQNLGFVPLSASSLAAERAHL
jgi:phosphate transport system substrate-binding protein